MNTALDKLKQWMYYFIIGIISFIALVFLPMIGTTIGLGWNVPNTTVGWIVWVATKLTISVINILIFHSFMCQAKINIHDDPKYVEARDILQTIKIKEYVPRSPSKWNGQQYGKKGTIVFITSALAVVAFTQAILQFDWVSMLSYLFTILMGLIFGVLQMKKAEEYWTDEFWKYAIMIREQNEAKIEESVEMAQTESIEQTNDSLSTDCRVDILESSDSDSNIGNHS